MERPLKLAQKLLWRLRLIGPEKGKRVSATAIGHKPESIDCRTKGFGKVGDVGHQRQERLDLGMQRKPAKL